MPGKPEVTKHVGLDEIIGKNHTATINPTKTKDERTHRLGEEAAAASWDRWREGLLFGAALLAFAAIFVFCGFVAAGRIGSADERKWAMAILGSFASGLAGYLFGKSR